MSLAWSGDPENLVQDFGGVSPEPAAPQHHHRIVDAPPELDFLICIYVVVS